MFNSGTMRDHARLVNHLADLFAAEDFTSAEDLDYLLGIFNTNELIRGKVYSLKPCGFALSCIGTLAESELDIERLVQLWEFLQLTGSLDDEKFAAMVTAPMEAEIAARLAKPQAVLS